MHSDSIEELIQTKVTLKNSNLPDINVYWMDGSIALDIPSKEKIPMDILLMIKKEIGLKLNVLWGMSDEQWLANYQMTSSGKNWDVYEDLTGLKDIIEIKVKNTKNELTIIEKKPTGTLKTKYQYGSKVWSKKLLVLNKVDKSVYEGIQSVKTLTNIEYAKVDGVFWLPVKITTRTKQKTRSNSSKEYIRELSEKIKLYDFKINKSEAVKWFSQQK